MRDEGAITVRRRGTPEGAPFVLQAENPDLTEERLAAVLEGRNDPGYNPPDHPIVTDDDPRDPDVKADH